MRGIIKTTVSIVRFVWDKLVLHTPLHLIYRLRPPGVAFLVHPRDITDIYRPFPIFAELPNRVTRYLGAKFGAITLSVMNTPNDIKGLPIRAHLLSIVMDPVTMEADRDTLGKNLAEMSLLAERKNLKLIALGALLPSVSQYGRTFTKIQDERGTAPAVTTGHICTAWCIQAIFEKIASNRYPSKQGLTVGVLGAAGSTGTLAVHMLDRLRKHKGWDFKLHLVDRNRRRNDALCEEIGTKCQSSSDIASLRTCDFIVVVTNAAEVVLHPDHVKEGAVIIDDTQPRATSTALVEKAYVVDVLAHVPKLDAKFNFGFKTKDRQVTFSCLAEMLLLAAVRHKGNFAVGPAAKQSAPGTVEQFFDYLEAAERAGIKIRPVTHISFAAEMPHVVYQGLMCIQEVQVAAE